MKNKDKIIFLKIQKQLQYVIKSNKKRKAQ